MGELDGLCPVVVLHVDIGRHVLRLGQRQGQDVSAQRHIHARGVCIGIKALAVRARQDRLHGPVRIQCGIQRAGSGVPLKLRRGVYGADGQRLGHRDVIAREGDAQGRSGAGLGRSVLRVSVADDPLAVLILQHEIAVSDELRAFDFPAGDGQGRLTVTVEQVEPLALPYGQSGQRLDDSHRDGIRIGAAIVADSFQRHPVGASGDGFSGGQGQQTVRVLRVEPLIVHTDAQDLVAVAFHQINAHARAGDGIQGQRGSPQPGRVIRGGHIQRHLSGHFAAVCGRGRDDGRSGGQQGDNAALVHPGDCRDAGRPFHLRLRTRRLNHHREGQGSGRPAIHFHGFRDQFAVPGQDDLRHIGDHRQSDLFQRGLLRAQRVLKELLAAGADVILDISGGFPCGFRCFYFGNFMAERGQGLRFHGGCLLALFVPEGLAADTAHIIVIVAVFRAGRVFGLDLFHVVTLRGNFLLRSQDFIADGAVLALGQTGLGAGGFRSLVDDLAVPLGRNLLLRSQHFIADGAVRSFRQAGLGAGRLYPLVGHFGVSKSGDFFLRGQHFAASGAVLALGQASLCAGRLHSLIYDLCMSISRNFFLCCQDFIADRAVFPFRQAGLCAGGFLSLVYDLGVPIGRNLILRGQHFIAD